MIACILLVFTVILIVKYYFTRTFNYWKSLNVKGPKPTIFFGNFKNVVFSKELITFDLERIYNEYRSEPVVGVYRMTTPWLIIKDLDIIKHVLIKDFEVFADRGVPVVNKKLDMNLFSSKTESWRVLRHQFTPLFTSGKLKNMLHLITERGEKFLDYVDIVTQKESNQEVHRLIQLYTLSSISACAFGLDIDFTSHIQNETFIKTLHKIDDDMFTKRYIQDFVVMYPNLFEKLSFINMSRNVTKFFDDLVATVIKQRDGQSSNRNDFMDLLLGIKNKGKILAPKRAQVSKDLTLEITDDIIVAQAFVFYAAGYETSATTMTFMLYELAKNPDIQEMVCQEIDKALGKSDGKITYDTLSQLPYMEKVFDETLRKYPLVDPLQRKAETDYKIPGTNITIKKGQIVVIPTKAIHFDETLYPDPEKFDPERFDPKVAAERHSCAYLPFGVGPRNCIGMRFAKVQSRVCMVELLSRFRVELADEEEMTFDMTRVIMAPRKGFRLKFLSRKAESKQIN